MHALLGRGAAGQSASLCTRLRRDSRLPHPRPPQDERCAKLALYPFLEKVYLERILQPAEVGREGRLQRAARSCMRCAGDVGCVYGGEQR